MQTSEPLQDSSIDAIELASFHAWPAFEETIIDGWLVRFAGGYTKRANSATFLFQTDQDPALRIPQCEEFYRSRRQSPIFRIVSRPETEAIDRNLEQRGYSRTNPSIVMTCPRDRFAIALSPQAQITSVPLTEWLPVYSEFSQTSTNDQMSHHQILDRIALPHQFGIVSNAGCVAACGLAVVEKGHCGFFDIVTNPQMRRKGYGTLLMRGLASWGIQQGARLLYLQVHEANATAQNLYRKLGFENTYNYWYRQIATAESL